MEENELKDRVVAAARAVAGFDGTLDSANSVLQRLSVLRNDVNEEVQVLHKELVAIDSLIEYAHSKRNRLTHGTYIVNGRVMHVGLAESGTKSKQSGPRTPVDEGLKLLPEQERVPRTIEAAMELVNSGVSAFGVGQVREQLRGMGIDLGVAQPASVIGTILNADIRFERVSAGRYEYTGAHSPGEKDGPNLFVIGEPTIR